MSNGFADVLAYAQGKAPKWLDDYYYDWDEHDRINEFFRRCLTFTQGRLAGQPFTPLHWQQWNLLGPLVAWKHKQDHLRRFTEGLFSIARGGGKTETVAGLQLFFGSADYEFRAENYATATDDTNARKLFKAAHIMIKNDPVFSREFKVREAVASIEHKPSESVILIVSTIPDSKHGLNPYFVSLDEYHTLLSGELKAVFQGGDIKRDQPMTLIFGTVGQDKKNTPMGKECELAERIIKTSMAALTGEGTSNDSPVPNYFAYLCQAPPDSDPFEPTNIMMANPGYPDVPLKRRFDEKIAKAKMGPEELHFYCWQHLNQWGGDAVAPIKEKNWDKLCKPMTESEFLTMAQGRAVIGGLDLASSNDLNAYLAGFVDDYLDFVFYAWFWLPEGVVDTRHKEHRVEYPTWIKNGFIETTQGDMTDYDAIEKKIRWINDQMWIKSTRIDPYKSYALRYRLEGAGMEIVEVSQNNWKLASPPNTEIIRRIENGKHLPALKKEVLWHPGNPVLSWNAKNVRLKMNEEKDIKFDKNKSIEKIDGMVAMSLSTHGLLGELREGNISKHYQEHGIATR